MHCTQPPLRFLVLKGRGLGLNGYPLHLVGGIGSGPWGAAPLLGALCQRVLGSLCLPGYLGRWRGQAPCPIIQQMIERLLGARLREKRKTECPGGVRERFPRGLREAAGLPWLSLGFRNYSQEVTTEGNPQG